MSKLSEFSTILGLYIGISSIINKAQSSEEENKIMNLLETGEGIAFLAVLNAALIYIHRGWFRKKWRGLKIVYRIYKRNGFYSARNYLFSKEREPLFMSHELISFLPNDETRKKARDKKWSREKLLRKVRKLSKLRS